MIFKQILRSSTVAILFSFNSTLLEAGEIVGYTPYAGINSVAGVAITPPVAPNNDDVAGISPNDLWVTQKHYVTVGAVDIVFDVVPTGGVTEYSIREGVDNSTGLDWSSYVIQLGFGVGAGFVPTSAGDGLDFDASSFNSPPDFTTFFSTVDEYENVLVAYGGLMPNGAFSIPYFRFSIDVPDTFSSFTLRQFPVAAVPEPASAGLALVAGVGTCGVLWRRRRGQ